MVAAGRGGCLGGGVCGSAREACRVKEQLAHCQELLAMDKHDDAPALIEQHLARIEGREPELDLKLKESNDA